MAARARTRSEGSPTQAQPRSDAYVGILLISLLLQIAGMVFLYMDYSQYPDKAPTAPPKAAAPLTAPGGGAGVPAGKGPAGVPPPPPVGAKP
jgi:hypothetical protein